MKPQAMLKSVRYGTGSRPSIKSTVLFALATFFLVIHVVKSSTIHEEEEEFTDDNRNLNNNPNGESNFLPLTFPKRNNESVESESLRPFPVFIALKTPSKSVLDPFHARLKLAVAKRDETSSNLKLFTHSNVNLVGI